MRNDPNSSPSPSTNPSSSSADSSSSRPSKKTQPPANAFRREFLDQLVERDEATIAGTEAETRGPWKVLQAPPAGGGGGGDGSDGKDNERWLVLRAWEKPEDVEPHATSLYREHALLWAAALEIASRGSNLGVGLTRDEEGLVISEWSAQTGPQTRGQTRLVELEQSLRRYQPGKLVDDSPALRRIRSTLQSLADLPTTVLITGESGTGKEVVVADALHAAVAKPPAPAQARREALTGCASRPCADR